MLPRFIRILLKTHIRFGTTKSMIPPIVHRLKFRNFYFHPQIKIITNHSITNTIMHILQLTIRKAIKKLLIPRIIRIIFKKAHISFGTAKSTIPRNVHQLQIRNFFHR
jgi:hypothetical protein